MSFIISYLYISIYKTHSYEISSCVYSVAMRLRIFDKKYPLNARALN